MAAAELALGLQAGFKFEVLSFKFEVLILITGAGVALQKLQETYYYICVKKYIAYNKKFH